MIAVRPARDPITHVTVPGNPFEPVATPDGCWIVVTVLVAVTAGIRVPHR
jgi:hypothetical protein